ncbi:MAG: class I SAM-dependent methyltransferase [Actinomycetota bacterium]
MTDPSLTPAERDKANQLRRRAYAKGASRFDKQMGLCERWMFGSEHRAWACSRAAGETLEVAIGTGLNLAHYPADLQLTGLDLSPEMLEFAASRAAALGRPVELKEGDAQELPFPDSCFDSVVCTYSLCSVPDVPRAISEMKRVVKPGGRLILLDHIRSSLKPIFWFQRLVEAVTARIEGEYMTRRPSLHVESAGLEIQERDRLRAGVVERLTAKKVQ